MDINSSQQSDLFLVRVWQAQREQPAESVRIQVRHVVSGETHNFLGWSSVVAFLSTRVSADPDDGLSGDEISR